VVTVDMPVADGTATFVHYRDTVLAVWPNEEDQEVILVGHSLGAMVVPLVADRRRVHTCVFLCPVVPNVAGMPWDGAPEMGRPGAYRTASQADGSVTFDSPEEAAFTFYNKCDPRDAAWAFQHLQPQNSASLWDRPYPLVELPPGRRMVIGGQHDRAITREFLEAVCKRRLGTEPVMMDTDHSPFLSATSELVAVLDSVAAQDGRFTMPPNPASHDRAQRP
jgi:pimeloyl-ACP methyl ester carboxylesterase